MSIHPYLSGAFGPDVISTMSKALDAACVRLEHEPRPGLMKDAIAKRIIELVHQGERDVRRLCAGALDDISASTAPSAATDH
jgi:hypothetical protein